MKSTEAMDLRLKRVDMHDYFLNKIEESIHKQDYIAASWLIYSCFENRYFRTIEKLKSQCKYCRSKSKCNKGKKNELELITKIKCIQRLHGHSIECIRDAFRFDLFKETIDWVNERNSLMYDLLSLEYYENTDEKFKKSVIIGNKLLNETYESCTKFRELFYKEDYDFIFPEEAMEKCSCKPRK